MQFIAPPLDNLTDAFLDEEESFHAIRVLRYKKGDEIKVFDGKKQYLAKIKDIKEGKVLICDFRNISSKTKDYNLNLFVPFVDKKEFEDILRHATELGVDNFIPIITDYTQKFFIPKRIDYDRLKKIVVSAVKQCERDSIPNLYDPIRLSDITKFEGVFLVGWLSKEDKFDLRKSFNFLKKNINVIIGPEGGFSQSEKRLFSNHELFIKINISPNVLRVKTASIALLGCIVFLLENENIF